MEEVDESEMQDDLMIMLESKLLKLVEDINNGGESESWDEEDDYVESEDSHDDEKDEVDKPRDTVDWYLKNYDVIEFLRIAGNCTMVMVQDAAYMQEALPSLEVDEHYKEGIKVVCDKLVSTKHDVINELYDFDDDLTSGMDKATRLTRAERVLLWLWEPIATLHDLVSRLKLDPKAGLAFILVAESGVNILNGYNGVTEAYETLSSE